MEELDTAVGPLRWRVEEAGPERVRLGFPWDENLANPDGVLHGGAIAASLEEGLARLAREVFGSETECAGETVQVAERAGGTDDAGSVPPAPGRVHVLERRIAFEHAGRGRHFAVWAEPNRVGRRTAFLRASLTDDAGRVCARAEAIATRFTPIGGKEEGPGRGMTEHPDLVGPAAASFRVPSLRQEILDRANPYRDALGVRLAMPQVGQSIFALEPGAGAVCARGALHTGVVLSLLDLGMGHALLSGVRTVERPITLTLEVTTAVPAEDPALFGTGTLVGGFGDRAEPDLYELAGEVVDRYGRTLARARAIFQGR